METRKRLAASSPMQNGHTKKRLPSANVDPDCEDKENVASANGSVAVAAAQSDLISESEIVSMEFADSPKNVQVLVTAERICVLTDDHIKLFNNDGVVTASFRLDCAAVASTVSSDGRFLVVVDSLGTLHFIHLLSDILIFSQQIVAGNDSFTVQAIEFSRPQSGFVATLCIIVNNNKVLLFSNVDTSALHDALVAKNSESATNIRSGIKLLQLCTEELLPGEQCFHMVWVLDNNDEILNLFFKSGQIIQMSAEGVVKRKAILHHIDDVKRVYGSVDHGQKRFIVARKNDEISIWDSRRLLILYTGQFENVTDAYCARVNGDNSLLFHQISNGSSNIVSVAKIQNELTYNILLAEMQERKIISAFHHLAVSDLHLPYLVGQKLIVARIENSSPVARIQTYLSQNRFEEAEKLAMTYQIPFETTWKAKLGHLQNKVNSENVTDVIDLLGNVGDVQTLTEFLLNCTCDSVSTFTELARSFSLTKSPFASIMKKLDTFLAISNDQLVDKFSVWKYFSFCPGYEIVCELLSKGEIVHAELFCARHADELSEDLSDVRKILDAIPIHVSVKDLVHFLDGCIVEKVISHEKPLLFFDWIVARAILMEETFNRPNQSSALVEAIFKMCQSRKSLNQFLLTCSHPFTGLRKRLRTLTRLRTDFDFHLSLSELSVQGGRVIAMALLDRVEAAEVFSEAIENDFIPFCTQEDLNAVDALGDYLIRLLTEWSSEDQSDVLHRVVSSLSFLKTTEKRKQVLVELFYRVSIPWPGEIGLIIDETEDMYRNTASTETDDPLKDQLQLLKLKKMLHKYGIVDFNFSDFSLADKALNLILSNSNDNNEHVLKDAFLLVEKYSHLTEFDSYIIRLQNVARQGRFELLKTTCVLAPETLRKEVETHFLNWLVSLFDRVSSGSLTERSKKKLAWITGAISVIVGLMLDRQPTCFERAFLNTLKNACLLFLQFDIVLNMKHWKSYSRRLKCLFEYASALNSTLMFDRTEPSVSKLYQLSDILQLEKQSFWAVLVKTALSKGAHEQVVRLIHDRTLFSQNAEMATHTVQIYYEIVNELVVASKNLPTEFCGSTYGDIIKMLCQEMMISSHSHAIIAVLDFWRKGECFSETIDKTSTGQYQTMMTGPTDCKFKVTSYQYEDDYLVMEINDLMSDLVSVIKSGQQSKGDSGKISFVSSALENITVLVDKLSDNRAYQLSGRWCDILCPLNQVYLETFNDTRLALLDKLVKKILTHNQIDDTLSFGYIISSPHKQAFEGIRLGMAGINSEFSRLTEIARIGGAAASIWQQRAFFVQLESLAKNSKWWEQFSVLELEFDENQFRHSEEYRRSFIPTLLEKTSYDLLTVAHYAEDYDIDLDSVYFEAIKKLLIYEHDREYENFLTMCALDIQNRAKYLEQLKELQQIVSPYDFSKIKFVFQLILKEDAEDEIAKKGLSILDVISSYKRRSAPAEEELKSIAERIHQFDPTLDISKFYHNHDKFLPYHELFIDPWLVIEKELCEDNVEFFSAMAVPLGLVPDELYLLVIEKLLNEQCSSTECQSRFAKIKGLVSKIKEPVLVYETWLKISDCLAMGSTKCQSLGFAVNTAEKLVRLARNVRNNDLLVDAESSLERAEKLLMRAEIAGLLSTENFQTEKFLALIEKPKELVNALYRELPFDPTNDVCLSIATCSNLVIADVQQELFDCLLKQKVLPPKNTKFLLLSMSIREDEEQIVGVLSYLLKSLMHEKDAIQSLLHVAYDSSRKVSTITRIRAIRTLFRCYRPSVIDPIHSFAAVEDYLSMLDYLLDCEDLRIVVTAKELAENSKLAFVKSLWISRNNDSSVLIFALKLLFDFKFYEDLELWEHILKKAVTIGRASTLLTDYCSRICSIPELLQIKNLDLIWHDIIVLFLDSYAKEGDEQHFQHALRLISTSPFMHYLSSKDSQIAHIAKKWSSSNDFNLVLTSVKLANHMMCLYLVPLKSAQQQLLQLISHDNCLKLVEVVFDHYLPNKSLLNSLFDYLSDKGWHDCLLPRKDISLTYIRSLIENDTIHDLVRKLVENGKKSEANRVAMMYLKHWSPESDSSDDALNAFLNLKRTNSSQ